MWTDGLLTDGERLYLIEFDDGHRIRMIDAFDGRFLDEWVSEQETTRSVAGQYDWINNKVWLGDLWGPDLYQYSGLGHAATGTVTTDPIGPAHSWFNLGVEASSFAGDVRIDLLGQDGGTGEWRTLSGYQAIEADSVDLGSLDASRYPLLRLRATLRDDGDQAPVLSALQVRFWRSRPGRAGHPDRATVRGGRKSSS